VDPGAADPVHLRERRPTRELRGDAWPGRHHSPTQEPAR